MVGEETALCLWGVGGAVVGWGARNAGGHRTGTLPCAHTAKPRPTPHPRLLFMYPHACVPRETPTVAPQVENLIRMLKLTNAKDTILGDNLIRGVSGGERKRVTVAEMIMGLSRVLVLGAWALEGGGCGRPLTP